MLITKRQKFVIEIIGLIGLLFILGGVVVPYLSHGEKRSELVGNTFQVDYEQGYTKVRLTKTDNISDEVALYATEPQVSFAITNLRDKEALYRIRFVIEDDSQIPVDQIKISYEKNGNLFSSPEFLSNLGKDFILLDNQKLEANTTDQYRFYVWLCEDGEDYQNKTFKADIIVEKIDLTVEEAKDTVPPVILLKDPLSMSLLVGEEFIDPGILSITDDVDGEISLDQVTRRYEYFDGVNKEAVRGIDTSRSGIYYIYYTVKDHANNEAIAVREVIVNKKNDEGEITNPVDPDDSLPLEVTVSYSTTEKTDQSVIVTIRSNIPLKPVSGWERAMDRLSLTKEFASNVTLTIPLISESGMTKLVQVQIQNIDKSTSTEPNPDPPVTPTPGAITVKLEFTDVSVNSVSLKAVPSNVSRVKEYYYRCGDTWSEATTKTTYVCTGLKQGTSYSFQVKAIDKDGKEVTSSNLTTRTLVLETPTFTTDTSGWATMRKVTIHYANQNANVIFQYRFQDSDHWETVTGTSQELTLTENKTIYARVVDHLTNPVNEVASSYIEERIDTLPPTLNNSQINTSHIGLTSVSLSWTAGNDNSTPMEQLNYYLCRSTSNSLSMESCLNQVIYQGKNVTTYQDASLSQGTTYYYGVVVEDQFQHRTMYQVKQVTTLVPTPTPTPTPTPSQGRLDIANKSNLVGINYSTWHYYMQTKNNNQIYRSDTGSFGPVGAFHYWSEPALGYYNSLDKSVIRTHMMQLAEAGVDFIIIDNTNVTPAMFNGNFADPSTPFYQLVSAPVKALLDTMAEMRMEGLKTPYVVPWQRTDEGQTMLLVFYNIFIDPNYDVQGLKDLGYDKEKWKDLWVYWNGKPFVLTTTLDRPDVNCEYRKMWGLQPSVSRGEWSYLQRDNRNNKGTNFSGQLEQMSVSVAMQQNRMSNTSSALGRRGGLTFYQQWYNAFQVRPKIITLTWWNEWGAERIASSEPACTAYCFTDNFNQEYSRDIEPMKGGHGDTYYQWMKQYIAAYKAGGSCPKLTN